MKELFKRSTSEDEVTGIGLRTRLGKLMKKQLLRVGRSSACRSERGRSLVELILVTPVLLAIPGGVLEIARFARLDQNASAFSQEAAMMAYRQCGDYNIFSQQAQDVGFDRNKTVGKTQACLNEIAQQMQGQLDTILPGSVIVLSVYRYNLDRLPNGNTVEQVAVANGPSTSPAEYKTSRMKVSSSAKTTLEAQRGSTFTPVIDSNTTTVRQRMVAAEVTFKYESIFKLIPGVNLITTNGVYRETTIL